MGYPDKMKNALEGHADMPGQLYFIAAILQHWIDFDIEVRQKEGLETTDDTHIMAPPTWPSHGQLKSWIKTLKSYQEGSS